MGVAGIQSIVYTIKGYQYLDDDNIELKINMMCGQEFTISLPVEQSIGDLAREVKNKHCAHNIPLIQLCMNVGNDQTKFNPWDHEKVKLSKYFVNQNRYLSCIPVSYYDNAFPTIEFK